jgi:hypothetical protein
MNSPRRQVDDALLLLLCSVLGRLHHGPYEALGRPASERRQGTKSREVSAKRYGDSSAGSVPMLVFFDDEGSFRAGPKLPIWVCEAA